MKNNSDTNGSRTGAIRHLLLTVLVPFALLPMPAGSWQLFDLGADVYPVDINNLGTIVGSRRTANGNVAFQIPAGGALQDIPGALNANAINDSGQIAGNTSTGAFLLDGGMRTWAGYGGYGINENGQISGNLALDNPYRPSPLPHDPAIYSPNQWDNLGIAATYPRGTQQGVYADQYILDDINDSGFAVGNRSRSGLAGSSAILTTPAFNGVTYLSFPNGGKANAINNQNLVVGVSGTNTTTGEYSHAYLYDYNAGTLHDLGTLNGGLTSSAADINDFNQVVGTAWLATQLTSVYDPAQYHAFIWANDVMSDLNDAVTGGSGWILNAATAINDNGDIVGYGTLDGVVHGFLLSTSQGPAPATGQPPVAVASADVTGGRAPLTVNFSSLGSSDADGPIAGYRWNFGDGSADSTAANPSHVYTVAGSYTAVLTVTDSDGMTASASVDITVRKGRGRQ